ncbi:Sua5/YciO/YrdC/YwlC family protein, partial [Desulfocurvibacter africanus]|uniref:Sua5/YciO/YrdC/YwlC family protein n=1 Tax=Desulfocurvibacter africanus TaxID=873 RepID=UPI002FD8A8BB
CLESGAPLIATSANLSGRPAAARPEDLDPALLAEVDAAVLEHPWPSGGAASTVVCLLGCCRLEVLRIGAVPARVLEQAGFRLRGPGE